MDLMSALKQFRSAKSFYSDLSVRTIQKSLGSRANGEFVVKKHFVADPEDRFHIHPTMIVAREPFPDSVNRGAYPYPNYPHHLPLSNFPNSVRGKKKAATR
jgi:hypothetical protein